MSRLSVSFFFFFQAEDGIRDRNVTGVQTCALPISRFWELSQRSAAHSMNPTQRMDARSCSHTVSGKTSWAARRKSSMQISHRSEERRVGKECRYRWSPYHEKKKKKHEKTADVNEHR